MRLMVIRALIYTCLYAGLFFPTAYAQKPELVVQTGPNGVFFVAFSPNGHILASAGADKTVKLWDVLSRSELRTLAGHMSPVYSVAFSPDGQSLASGDEDDTIKLWDVASGRELRTLGGHPGRPPFNVWVLSVAFSPDGHTLASGSGDKTIKLWDVASGEELRTLAGHTNTVESVAFSPDGQTLVSGSWDNTIKLWDVASGREQRTLAGHYKGVVSVAFSPDGHTLASGSDDKTIKLWEVASGRELRTLFGHTSGLKSVAFSPDGHTLASGSNDKTIKLWEVASGRELRTLFGHTGVVGSVAFSPDGHTLASGSWDNTIKLWDVASGRELETLVGHTSTVESVAFSPDGRTLALGSRDNTVKLWDLTGGRELRTLVGHTGWVMSVAFSPDGRTLASGSSDETIKLWDVAGGREMRTLVGHKWFVASVAFSPDGHILASGSWDKTVKLWDVADGHELRTLVGRIEQVNSVAFSPDGHILASGSPDPDRTIKLWDVASGRELRTLGGQFDDGFESVSFSPDGRTLASGSEYSPVKLWDVADGHELRTLKGHMGQVWSVAFSPDGHTLASGSFDNTVKLWDAADGHELRTLAGHTNAVKSVSFSPDSRTLASGFDGRVKLWDVATGRELASLFALDRGDWAVVDSQGRFDASPGGMELMHWVVGTESIDLSQLKERYYEPGLLAKVMGFNKDPLRQVEAFTDPKLYPQVSLTPPEANNPKLGIHLTNRGGGIGRVEVLINGKEVEADARGPSPNPSAQQLKLAVDVGNQPYLIPGEDNVLEVRAYNAEGYLVSRGDPLHYKAPGQKSTIRPSFWAIVTGISDYQDESLRLQFAGKDAEDMARALRIGAERLFGKDQTHITVLTSAKVPGAVLPTHDNLRNAFEAARQAKSTDILAVYLAGHGVNFGGQEGDYYYLTQEARSFDLTDPEVRRQTSVSSQELTEWIKQIPATKEILVLDTCGAARLVEKLTEKRGPPSSQIRSLERMKDRTGLFILAGSAADAQSYEATSYGQGLLTYSLLLGMRGAALRENSFVDVTTWFAFASDEVPKLAKDLGGIQQPMPATPKGGASFDIGQLVDEDKARIPLPRPHPLFLQSSFQDEVRPLDHLKLTSRVNDGLREVSGGGPNAVLVYVDASDLPGAYLLAGRYHVEGSSVKVRVSLFKGEKEIGNFTVDGNTTELDSLAARIVGEAKRTLRDSR